MSKDALPESDFVNKSVRPAIVLADWHTLNQIHAQFSLRAVRMVVRGNKAHREMDRDLEDGFALFHKPNIHLRLKTLAATLRLGEHALFSLVLLALWASTGRQCPPGSA